MRARPRCRLRVSPDSLRDIMRVVRTMRVDVGLLLKAALSPWVALDLMGYFLTDYQISEGPVDFNV
eukprot:9861021-Alexandrium_andersonii.AAC.2